MKISELKTSMMADDKIQNWIEEINATQRPYPENRTVHSYFSEQAKSCPQAIALRSKSQSISYLELDKASNRLASFLMGKGINIGQCVAFLLDKKIETVVCILGILKAGAIYVPLDTKTPLARLKFIIDDTKTNFLISEVAYLREMNDLQYSCGDLRRVLCIDSERYMDEIEPEGQWMKEEVWDYVGDNTFDDISGGGWKSSFTGELLSRQVMDIYGENIRQKLLPVLHKESRILEIGCASGISMFRLAPLVEEYCGTDLSAAILAWTAKERSKLGQENIQLHHLPAHETHQLDASNFDVVILNSVVQCFSGLNYLRQVLKQAIEKLSDKGTIFLGQLWDLERKQGFTDDLCEFKASNAKLRHKAKADFDDTLFLSKEAILDLLNLFPEIKAVKFSDLPPGADELAKYGFDAILEIDKTSQNDIQTPATLSKDWRRQYDKSDVMYFDDAAIKADVGSRDLAYIMYTSGTSGAPKGVMIEHRSILRLVKNQSFYSFSISDCLLQTGSIAFDASVLEVWGILLNGGSLCCCDGLSSPETYLDLIKQFNVKLIWLTSSFCNQLIEFHIELFASLQTLFVGGEQLSSFHMRKLRKHYPSLHIVNGYGPTENTTFSCCYHLPETIPNNIPIGRPIGNSQAYVLDRDGQALFHGVTGEICVGGHGLFRGYLNNEELTRQAFVAHPYNSGEYLYRTGDKGRWLEDGQLEFLGRLDNQVKIRGYRVEPEEVQASLLGLAEVSSCAVVDYCAGANSEKELVAYCVFAQPLEALDLKKQLASRVPEYMVPTYIIAMESLPLNKNGKLDRASLPDPLSLINIDGTKKEKKFGNTVEAKVSSIWEEVLGHKSIDIQADFFQNGGHSLNVIKVLDLIEKKMGVVLPLSDLFEASTIPSLAARIVDRSKFGVQEVDDLMACFNMKSGQPNVFSLPPGTGDALGYMQLASLIPSINFYAFNFIANKDIVSLAADKVIETDPKGPYKLLGYSAGGNLAYHLAYELESRAYKVETVVMLDSGRTLRRFRMPDGEVQRVTQQFLSHGSVQPYLLNETLKEKASQRISAYYSFIENTVDTKVICADIVLLRCVDSIDQYFDENKDLVSDKGAWRDATTGRVEIISASGDHNSMLYPPHLEDNAKKIIEILT